MKINLHDLFLIFLFLIMCDITCARHGEAMTMQPQGDVWVVDFDAHPDNETLEIFIECHKGDGIWKAAVVGDIDPTDTHIRVRRPELPKGWGCTAVGSVMRNPQHEHDRDKATIGESVLIIIQ